ncbi:conserved hypothetical protein [Methanolacinia petrolearia DSM 11571]|uniref:DUF1015 domain-containing protein n=1 Tax=Methanolacinia petrolearia (strain DSM 11571 / OCM 486 / SEBR 4847) TaxID=679926 RepID=E1RHK7_METP4|nr:DUF1015 family protein [Methanolacinia petrolearia]ADN35316.1 conserved hypothetical protein [Methanolacinia petrolearia DSM 11571]
MVKIFSFPAIRPAAKDAGEIACVPYDVISREEAMEWIDKHPDSFMKVIRSDAVLPDLPAESEEVYAEAKKNLEHMIKNRLLVRDDKPGIYLYRVKQGGNIYTGFVANVSVDDYIENKIKKHELTRYDKEIDRTTHIDVTNTNTGLVVLLYRDPGDVFHYIESLIPEEQPDSIVKMDSGIVHEVFRISDDAKIKKIIRMFEGIDSLYIADGHHRAKSSVNVALKRRENRTSTDESERFMAVIFSENRVKIHGYSRLVTDLGKYTPESFMKALGEKFEIKKYGEIDDTVFRIPPLKESGIPRHVFHMYLKGEWYEITCPLENPGDTIGSLDVSVLQKKVMEDMLGINDPRGDPRLQYLGGARPLSDLEMRVNSGEFAVALSMQPVKVETVLKIADEGNIMPPKSTWFEPKLLSGLTLHTLD